MTTAQRGTPARYIWSVATVGVVLAAFAIPALGLTGVDPLIAAVLCAAMLIGFFLPLRLQHSEGAHGFTLEEGVFVAALLTLPSGWAPLLVTATVLLGHGLQRRAPQKLAFNVGQAGLWSVAAAAVHAAVAPADEVWTVGAVGAVVAAAVTLNVVSLGVFAELFRRLRGQAYRQTFAEMGGLYAVTALGNTSFGILLAVIVWHEPSAAVLALTIMVGLALGYRGYAGLVEETRRTGHLHAVTSTLVGFGGDDAVVGRFLEQVGVLFGGDTVRLALFEEHVTRVHVHTEAGNWLELRPREEELPESVAVRAGAPALLGDRLVAPLSRDGRCIGVLSAAGRRGLEPWSEREAVLLGSVANELAVALDNVVLFRAVEAERAHLEQETRKLGDIVHAASDGIVLVGSDGRIAAWNAAMTAITGLPADDAQAQPCALVLRMRTDDDGEVLTASSGPVAAALGGYRHTGHLEVQLLRLDGTWRWVRMSVAPVERDGEGVVGAVLVVRDVTRERETDELKADFVATVSHELRTPLTPLLGFVDLLRRRGTELPPASLGEVYGSMERQARRLESLVADLLTVADLDRGGLEFRREVTDVHALVTRVVEESGAGDRISVEGASVHARTDERAAARVVRAMVDNAVKHTDDVSVVRVIQDGDEVVVEVHDRGPGIARWDLERIFQRFGRLGDHLHRTQGPGLGLSIARALARELGGDVTVSSKVGEGSHFRFTLPGAEPLASVLASAS